MGRKRTAATVVAILSCACSAAHAADIANPSFEADTYVTFPGYISGNGGTLTGWTATGAGNTTNAAARTGINANPATWNPANANNTPFGNNGVYPDGSKVGFIQAVGTTTAGATTTLSNTLTGLTPGQSYRVTFNFTSRNNGVTANQRPNASAGVGGYAVSFQVNPLEAANTFTQPFRTGSLVFTATGTTQTLSLSNTAPAAATAIDSTLVIDNFRVSTATTGWKSSAWTGDATSGVDNARYYTHAYNLGSSNTASVNGVTFAGVDGGNPAVPNSFSTTGWTSALADAANDLITAGGGTGVLGSTFVYGGSAQTAQTLTLTGLIPGVANHLTLYGVGFNDAASIARAFTASDGNGDTLTLNEHEFGVDKGIRFDFDYTPASTSQTFTFNPTSTVTTFHLYGFANSVDAAAVPEPASLAAFAAASLLLTTRRQRHRP
jgi:hypothetical protein